MKIVVVGIGYVGLSNAALLAQHNTVVAVDISEARVSQVNSRRSPIIDTELQEFLSSKELDLTATTDLATASSNAEIVIVATPTDYDPKSNFFDTSSVEGVVQKVTEIAPDATIIKSTFPVGFVQRLREETGNTNIIFSPEFLREGTAVNDFLHPDRVVVGADDRSAAENVAALYESIDTQVIITDAASAETIKYAANGFLAMKISFVNAVAAMCEAVGADVVDVVEGIGSDRRIGREFLRPGPGWGGSCFPKDSHALVHVAASHGYDFSMMRGVIAVNDEQRERMVRKVQHAAGTNDLNGMTISVLGLTFKAGTDDLRDSPSLAVINRLRELGATVKAYDPTTTGTLSQIQQSFLSGISVQQSIDEAMSEGDVLVILTEWPEFTSLNLERAKALLSGSAIVDTRNLLDPETVRAAGLRYDGVGRLA